MTPLPRQDRKCSRLGDIAPILLIGATGMLGRAWRSVLQSPAGASAIQHDCPSHQELDLGDPSTWDRWVTDRYRTVINCAAYTDVDGAEADPDLAMRMNGDAVGHLAQHCAKAGAMLVHYSTDYVFNGQSETPYRTDQPRDPINAYGQSKAAGEQAIEAAGGRSLIIRTSWLYAPWGNNFVKTMLQLTQNRDQIRVVNDQRGRPTDVTPLAANTAKLLEHDAGGLFHVTDGGECTWYDFACEIVKLSGHQCRVGPCTSDEFPRPAPRPAYSVLDLTQTESLIGAMGPWKKNLASTIKAIQDSEP